MFNNRWQKLIVIIKVVIFLFFHLSERNKKKHLEDSDYSISDDSQDFIEITSSEEEKVQEKGYDSDKDPAWTPFGGVRPLNTHTRGRGRRVV